jgi:hypothetical protein
MFWYENDNHWLMLRDSEIFVDVCLFFTSSIHAFNLKLNYVVKFYGRSLLMAVAPKRFDRFYELYEPFSKTPTLTLNPTL